MALGDVKNLKVAAKGPTWLSVVWDSALEAVSYDISTNSGSTFTNVTIKDHLLTGRTTGDPVVVSVRSVSASGAKGAWVNISGIPSNADNISKLSGFYDRTSWITNGTAYFSRGLMWLGDETRTQKRNTVSRFRIPLNAPGEVNGDFQVTASVGTGADSLFLGFIDGGAPETWIGTDARGIEDLTGKFYGFDLNVYEGKIKVYAGGGTAISTSYITNPAKLSHEKYTVRYNTTASDLVMKLYRSNSLLVTHTVPRAPASLTSIRLICAGWVGSTSGTFTVMGEPTWWNQNTSNISFEGVESSRGLSSIIVDWDNPITGVNYEYRFIDQPSGNVSTVSTTTSNSITFSVPETTRTLQLRVELDGENSNWNTVFEGGYAVEVPELSFLIKSKNAYYYSTNKKLSGPFVKDLTAKRTPHYIGSGVELRPLKNSIQDSAVVAPKEYSNTLEGLSLGMRQEIIDLETSYATATSSFTIEFWVSDYDATPKFSYLFRVGLDNGYVAALGNTNDGVAGNLFALDHWGDLYRATSRPLMRRTGNAINGTHFVWVKSGTTNQVYVNGNLVSTLTSNAAARLPRTFSEIFSTSTSRFIYPSTTVGSLMMYPSAFSVEDVRTHYKAGSVGAVNINLVEQTSESSVFVRWDEDLSASTYEIKILNNANNSSLKTVNVNKTTIFPTTSYGILSEYTLVTGIDFTGVSSYRVEVTPITSTGNRNSPSSIVKEIALNSRYMIFADNYNREPTLSLLGSPQFGGTYTTQTGVWNVSATGSAGKTTNVESLVTFGSANDFSANIVYSPEDAQTGLNVGFAFRVTNSNNFMALMVTSADRSLYFLNRVSGTVTNLMFIPKGYNLIAGDVITLNVVGTRIAVLINNQILSTFDDPMYSSTENYKLGLYSPNNGTVGYRFTDIVVWNKPSGPILGDKTLLEGHIYKGHETYDEDLGEVP